MKKILFLFLFSGLVSRAHAQEAYRAFSDSLAEKYLNKKSGALVIGIYDNGKESVFYYGETAAGNNKKPDNSTIFEIGGISQTFTSVLFADMTVKGIVGIDDKLQDYLPVNVPAPVYQEIVCMKVTDSRMPDENREPENMRIELSPYVCFPDPATKPQFILLCDLATNTTGLPKYPDNLHLKKNCKDPFASYNKDNLYEFIKNYRFDKPMGYDYKQSDVGIALLGHALSLKTNLDFDSLMENRLLAPLQMTSTRVKLAPDEQLRLVTGHNKKGRSVPNWNYNILAPAGGLHSCSGDMMKFLIANIGLKKDYYSNLLDFTHNPRLKLTGRKDHDTEIALGWKVNALGVDEKRFVWQDGLTGGFSSFIGFVETNHTGVVILSSVASEVNSMGKVILQKLAHEKL